MIAVLAGDNPDHEALLEVFEAFLADPCSGGPTSSAWCSQTSTPARSIGASTRRGRERVPRDPLTSTRERGRIGRARPPVGAHDALPSLGETMGSEASARSTADVGDYESCRRSLGRDPKTAASRATVDQDAPRLPARRRETVAWSRPDMIDRPRWVSPGERMPERIKSDNP